MLHPSLLSKAECEQALRKRTALFDVSMENPKPLSAIFECKDSQGASSSSEPSSELSAPVPDLLFG